MCKNKAQFQSGNMRQLLLVLYSVMMRLIVFPFAFLVISGCTFIDSEYYYKSVTPGWEASSEKCGVHAWPLLQINTASSYINDQGIKIRSCYHSSKLHAVGFLIPFISMVSDKHYYNGVSVTDISGFDDLSLNVQNIIIRVDGIVFDKWNLIKDKITILLPIKNELTLEIINGKSELLKIKLDSAGALIWATPFPT